MTEAGDSLCRSVDDLEGVVACYRANGVVAVTGVLTKEECAATLGDMGLPPSFSIRDPATYRLPEVERTLNRYGVVGAGPLWTPTTLRNRCHKNVMAAYKVGWEGGQVCVCVHVYTQQCLRLCLCFCMQAVYGTEDILACHDRAAVMRPTAVMGGDAMDTEYKYPGLHLDIDPRCFCGGPESAALVQEYLSSLHYADDRSVRAHVRVTTCHDDVPIVFWFACVVTFQGLHFGKQCQALDNGPPGSGRAEPH
jgi:hypothetical protein